MSEINSLVLLISRSNLKFLFNFTHCVVVVVLVASS